VALQEDIVAHAVSAAAWLAAYEVIIILAAYADGVLVTNDKGKTRSREETIANEVSALISGSPTLFRKQYAEYIIRRHPSSFFVASSLSSKDLQTTTAAAVQFQPDGQIWDFLEPSGDTGRRIVFIGSAGSGKTTLLEHAALTLAGQAMRHPAHLTNKLPVLLVPRDLTAAVAQNPEFTLAQAFEDSLADFEDIKPHHGWFEESLHDGQCVVMMDGLDEVVDEQIRKDLIAWIARQMETYAKSTFLITSRPWAYRSDLIAHAEVLELCPFDELQQAQFVKKWYLANGAAESAKLIGRLRSNTALSDLAGNPLLLTIITTLHRGGHELPINRVALIRDACEANLLACPAQDGPGSGLTAAQLLRVLELLAYQMMCRNIRVVTATDAIQIIDPAVRQISPKISPLDFFKRIEGAGLLLERDPGAFSFSSPSIQEYLTAVYIYDRRSEDELIVRMQSNWWHETVRLYCAISGNITPFVSECLAADDGGLAALTFSAECIDDDGFLEQYLRNRLCRLAIENLESHNPELRKRAAEALLTFRLLHMSPVGDDRSIDGTLVTNAEYQLFLNDHMQLGRRRQPDHWKTTEFPEGQANVPIKGVRPSDVAAFCNWLRRRHPGAFLFRPPSADEAGMKPISDGAGDNLQGAAFWTQSQSGKWEVSVDGHVSRVKLDLDRFRTQDIGRALDLVPKVEVGDTCGYVKDLPISFGDPGPAREVASELNLALRRVAGYQGSLEHELRTIETDGMQDYTRFIPQTLAEELRHVYHIALTMVRVAAHARYLFLARLIQSLPGSNRSNATMKIAESVESKVVDIFNTSLDAFLDIEAIRAFDSSFCRAREMPSNPEYQVQTANPGDFDYAVNIAQSFDLSLLLETAVNSSRVDVIASGSDKEGALEAPRILQRAKINADAVANILNRDRQSAAVELSEVIDARIGLFHYFQYYMYATGGFDDRLIEAGDYELYRRIGKYGIVLYNALAELQCRMENASHATEGIRLVKESSLAGYSKSTVA